MPQPPPSKTPQHPFLGALWWRPRRLDKFLADAGLGPRREVREALRAGRVCINDAPQREPWALVRPQHDHVTYEGRPTTLRLPGRYGLLYKPEGFISALRDPFGRPHLSPFLPTGWRQGVNHIGRLDKATTGALLLTDDGDLSWLLATPGHGSWKRYCATLGADISAADHRLALLREGLSLSGHELRPAKIRRDGPRTLRLWLQEGRYRQIRRALSILRIPLDHLHREAVGPIELGALRPGQLRALTPCEVGALYRSVQGAERIAARSEVALKVRAGQDPGDTT